MNARSDRELIDWLKAYAIDRDNLFYSRLYEIAERFDANLLKLDAMIRERDKPILADPPPAEELNHWRNRAFAAESRLDSLRSLAENLRMKCAIEGGHSHCQLCTHSLSEPPDAEDRAYCYFASLSAAVVEAKCTCPGWCSFNPGQHHANCTCKASVHGLEARVVEKQT